MKQIIPKLSIIIWIILTFMNNYLLAKKIPESVAFFYTKKPPLYAYYLYDWIIVEPELISLQSFKKELFWLKRKAKLIAYFSVGERPAFEKIPQKWILGKNHVWKTFIIDIRKKECFKYIFRQISFLIKKGFDGIFLDTLDAYQKILPPDQWNTYEKAEITLIKNLKSKFPEMLIIVNRPFNIVKEIKDYIDGFVAESLFYTWDFKQKKYRPQKKNNTFHLLSKLLKLKEYKIPIIVIDYVPLNDTRLAEKIAFQIKKLGFIPWVTDWKLSSVGISNFKPIARNVLFLYNGKIAKDPANTPLHLMIQMPLEWLGFVPVFWDISKSLPKGPLINRFGAIFVWIGDKAPDPKKFYSWILQRIKEGIKVFFLEDFGFPLTKKYLNPLGIEVEINRSNLFAPIEIIKKASFVGFETAPEISYYSKILNIKKGKAIIIAKNDMGQKFVPLAITPWGGYALKGSLFVTRRNPFADIPIPVAGPLLSEDREENLWVVNPFKFFSLFLSPNFPVPDVTTEDGKRLLTIHIDGDGFSIPANFNPFRLCAEVIRDEILKKFKVPHTVSIIEAEIAPWGINQKKASKLEKIAKSIFALPWVEPASHSFSHPFSWEKKNPRHLPVKDYKFNLKREIEGSLNYITNRLLKSSRKRPLFFWTGDTMPSEKALSLVYKLKVYNIDGGWTAITHDSPFLSHISPLGINRGKYFQVYAPVENEEVYTHGWKAPFNTYINVISTFQLTDHPRRLKPIGIYYHFFSGQKLSSLNALKKVYKWALTKKVKPIYLSEYAQKVLEFRATAIAKEGKCWIVRNGGHLRTLRLPLSFKIDLKKSRGVKNWEIINNSLYLFLDKSGEYKICSLN